MEALEEATNILDQRTSTHYIHVLDRLISSDDILSDQMAQMKLGTSDTCRTATRAKPTRTRKPAVKTTAKSTRNTSKLGAGPVSASAMEDCRPLLGLRGDILRKKAAALLLQDKLTTAATLLAQAASIRSGHEGLVQQSTIEFRRLVLQATKEMAADFTFNVLPESTISFPALARPERKMSEPAASRAAFLSPLRKSMVLSPSPRKGGRAKRVVKEDFTATLRSARDCVAGVQALALQTCSVSVVHQICTVFSHITVLLSAVNPGVPKGSLHPLSAALSMGKSSPIC
jgi:separase